MSWCFALEALIMKEGMKEYRRKRDSLNESLRMRQTRSTEIREKQILSHLKGTHLPSSRQSS
jgi:hypothetical protein